MNLWKTIPVAMAFVASFAAAQNNEEIQKQLARQESELRRLNAELTELKANGAMTAADAALETEVNRLSERLAAATSVKSGASQLTFSGLFRSRFMLTDVDVVGTDRSTFNRLTVGTRYDFSKDVTANLSLTNNYVTGQGTGNTSVDIYESWVEVRNLFGCNGLSARHGRQEFVQGNQFIFGNEDWNNGLVWDGCRVDYSNDQFGLTGFLFNQTGNFSTVDQYVGGLYGTLKSVKDMTIDGYWVTMDALTATAAMDIFGGRIAGNISGIDFNGEVAVVDSDIFTDNPLGLEINAGYMLNKDNKFHVHGQYAMLEQGFVSPALNLHGDRYGYLASFNGFGFAGVGAANTSNLESISFGAKFDPSAAWTIGANVFFNDAETSLANVDDSYTEINLGVDYRYSDTMTLGLGLGYVIPGVSGANDIVLGFLEARLAF